MSYDLVKIDDVTDVGVARMETVDELLAACCLFGRVRLCQMSKGWYVCIELPCTNPATKAQVQSRFDHPFPQDALRFTLEAIIKDNHDPKKP